MPLLTPVERCELLPAAGIVVVHTDDRGGEVEEVLLAALLSWR